ncbi:MAG: hypothetical protein VB115_10680 [Christensenellaceae bacterium]|nr:hypothetical protein [Christensenellaceae bacterium]
MKNYQRLYYQHYYAQNPDGECVSVTRRECFALTTPPTADNLYPQRWHYDPEAGYVIRLARTKTGDDLGKRNAADLKSEERARDRKYRCVWKGTKNCDQNCARCNRRHISRTVELDKSWGNDNDPDLQRRFDIADEAADIEAIVADGEMLAALIASLDKLSEDDRELWTLLRDKAKKQEIADHFNLTLDGVRYREKRLFAKLRADKTLSALFV